MLRGANIQGLSDSCVPKELIMLERSEVEVSLESSFAVLRLAGVP